MSESIAALIWIGGTISRSLAEDLRKAVYGNAKRDFGEGYWKPDTVGDLLGGIVEFEGPLYLCDEQATYGQFPFEQFLRDHGIPFDRRSEAKGEYEAELVQFRPGMSEPYEWKTTQDGEIVIPRGPIKRFLNTLEKRKIADFGLLIEAIGPDIPKLEPLTIKED